MVTDLIGDFNSKIHSIDRNVFCDEMTAIHLELISMEAHHYSSTVPFHISYDRLHRIKAFLVD